MDTKLDREGLMRARKAAVAAGADSGGLGYGKGALP